MRSYLLGLVVALSMTASVAADHHAHSYPKVRTFSGGYYGPTQAHYQYQRRYGRPWHGQGGLHDHHHNHRSTSYRTGFSSRFGLGWPWFGYSSVGYGYRSPWLGGGYGYSTFYGPSAVYGPGCSLFGFGATPLISYPLGVPQTPPGLTLQSPGVYTPFWSSNPYINDGLLNNGQLWQQEDPGLQVPQFETLDVEPLGKGPLLPPASTPQARLRSLQQQQQGDARLRNLDYLQAYLRYKEAIDSAADRAEPHYRLGIALAGMKRFDKAVRELKLASDLDPTWVNAISLDELLGIDNQIGKVQLKQRVADWTLADAHDADRLYLLGMLLHLDGDRDRARILVDTAIALVGGERHLTAFQAAPPESRPSDSVPGVPAQQEDRISPDDPIGQPPAPGIVEPAPVKTPAPPSVPQGPVFPSQLN